MSLILEHGDGVILQISEPIQREFGFKDQEIEEMPIGLLFSRIDRAHERMQHEIEKSNKEFVLSKLMEARSVFFGLQNTQDLPPLPSETKKKPNEQKIKKTRDAQEKAQEAYHKAISHAYWFEEYMGLPHQFDPPDEPEEKTSHEFREQRRQEVAAREQRFSSALRSMAEASGNTFGEEE